MSEMVLEYVIVLNVVSVAGVETVYYNVIMKL